VRQPGTALALVHAEALETELDALCERGRPTGRIGEDEHPDGLRLAVADRLEEEWLGLRRLVSKDVHDGPELALRPTPEKRECDVEAGDGSATREVLLSPADEGLDRVIRKLQREEEPDPLISLDGTRRAHLAV